MRDALIWLVGVAELQHPAPWKTLTAAPTIIATESTTCRLAGLSCKCRAPSSPKARQSELGSLQACIHAPVEPSDDACRLRDATSNKVVAGHKALMQRTYEHIVANHTRFFICVLVFSFAGLAGVARASGESSIELAEQTAEGFWGNVPCGSQIAVQWQTTTPTPALAGTEVEAWVTFETPLGNTNFQALPDTYTDCQVNISSSVWPTYASTVEAYPQFCQMMIHEFGHFEGYADSTSYAQSDIRYPLLSSSNLPSVCMRDLASGPSNRSTTLSSLSAVHPRTRTRTLVRTRCFEVGCGVAARPIKSKPR